MRVNIDRMIEKTEGVATVDDLANYLQDQDVAISSRTLYRWQKDGIGFNHKKLVAAAVALHMELRDIIII